MANEKRVTSKEKVMSNELERLNELTIAVRSRILERISSQLASDAADDPKTMYTKSDGTNYGMYQKAGLELTEIWDAVINQRSKSAPTPLRKVESSD